MQARISKWGNSLGVRVPLALAKQAGITDGQTVSLTLEDDRLIIRRSKKFTLKQLLSKITSENLHGEVSTGKRRGREEW